MASYLINELTEVEKKRYLELGVYHNACFNAVRATNKVSVDIANPATFVGSTDAFFCQVPPDEQWDVVYIDACHNWRNVYRDLNNSILHLAPGGVIFLHDLIPPSEEMTAPWYCEDAYKVLFWILSLPVRPYEMYSCDSDYGLTMLVGPTETLTIPDWVGSVTFHSFENAIKCYKRYSREEMIEIVRKVWP